jgi:hypothetical protein
VSTDILEAHDTFSVYSEARFCCRHARVSCARVVCDEGTRTDQEKF